MHGLAVRVRRHGGEIRTGVAAAAVEHDDQVHAVRLADGTTLPAAGVVVAVNDPRQALGLLDGPAAARLADAVDDMVPLRMAHLDVALRPSPQPPPRTSSASTGPCTSRSSPTSPESRRTVAP